MGQSTRRSARARNTRVTPSAGTFAGALLAFLALYAQLLASVFCAATTADAAPRAEDAFAICHTVRSNAPSDEHKPSAPGGVPLHDQQNFCALCAVHCLAPIASPPTIGGVEAFFAVPAQIRQASFSIPCSARFPAGAPPRGPPMAA